MARKRKQRGGRPKEGTPGQSGVALSLQRPASEKTLEPERAAHVRTDALANDPPHSAAAFPRSDWLWALLLVVLTILAYEQAWHAGYIWDDDKYVTQNELLTAPDGLRRIWFSLDSPSQYFPLVYTTFRIEHALWGLHPAGYHWINILLHAANAVLVWWLLRSLRVPGAWLAAAFFALHPVHVESVAWITERKNVLMGIFFLLSLLCWTRFVDQPAGARWRLYALALLFYALSLFSKTTACTIPAALLLILWLRHKPIDRRRVVQVVPFVLLGLAMGLLSIWWERHQQGTQGQLFAIGLPERVLIASRAVWFYLGKLLWPTDLAFSYPRWEISAHDPWDYLWLGAILALAAAVFYARRHLGRGLEVALLFFVTTLSPMLGFIMLYTFRYTFVADHYQYLASIGPLAIAAAGIVHAGRWLGAKEYFVKPLVCAALLMSLGALTWRQARIYADEETLWRATIAVNPASWMAHNNLGIKRLQAGAIDEAVAYYKRAIELNPSYAEAHFNLGNAFARMGNPVAAVAEYKRALELFPEFPGANANLGSLLLESGQPQDAFVYLAKGVELEPGNAAAHSRLGAAWVRLGRVDAGIVQLREALRIDARSVEAHNNLGRAFEEQGRNEEARAEFQTAVELNPSSAATATNLGNLLVQIGKPEEALPHLQKAMQLEPQSAQGPYNLGNALLGLRRLEDAAASYRRALELNPNYARARNNLANVLHQLGRLEEAVVEYEKALQINPDYAVAHYNLGRALTRLGRDQEAQRHLQRAAELDAQRNRGAPSRD